MYFSQCSSHLGFAVVSGLATVKSNFFIPIPIRAQDCLSALERHTVMKKPLCAGSALLTNIHTAQADTDGFHVWWLGQSGFLIQWEGRHLLFDPYLSDSLTKKYAATDKPHIRMTERVIAPEALTFIDVVTSSHNHTDHLDGETLGPLMSVNPNMTIVVPAANRVFAANRLQVDADRLTGLEVGKTVDLDGFQITAIPAAHNELDQDDDGRYKYVGYVVSFGPWTVYHSGDTLWYDGLVEYLKPWTYDLMLLPINGNKPERRVAGNLDGGEAALLAYTLGARMVIPCHYDMFTFNTVSPDFFVSEAERLGQPYTVLQNGEQWTCRPT